MKNNLCGGGISEVFDMNCADFSNGVKSVQLRKLETGKYQMREDELNPWRDCEVEFDEKGILKSISYVMNRV